MYVRVCACWDVCVGVCVGVCVQMWCVGECLWAAGDTELRGWRVEVGAANLAAALGKRKQVPETTPIILTSWPRNNQVRGQYKCLICCVL